ncbi:MAG: hypothetical protein GY873_16155 [Bosea sp.]|uniref:efflux RND transporter permease subunit n=1 Tax=Bosea sp. (in: a-proteobacteria) TaxID=1871050 RepID=UPI00238BCAA6|nr:hypothetical protein [Bosea sp. (in: a-proteobacteria)]MCP4735719.1 hypothetical protein [Bosea sp. (in: a-proteobacteria)]
MLRPPKRERGRLFRAFDRVLDASRSSYLALLGHLARCFLVMLAGSYALFPTLPTGFIPSEDLGYLFVNVQLPNAASLERTEATLADVTRILGETPGVSGTIGISGSSMIGGGGSEAGMGIVEAALAGTTQCFRPVLMTAFASVLDLLPLVLATGAGRRRSIGMTLFGGLLVGTVAGLLVIPLLYILVQSAREAVKWCLGWTRKRV